MRGVSKEDAKQALRSAALTRRNSLSEEDCRLLSRAIQSRAIEFGPYIACRSVALYSPVQNEVRTGAILAHAFGSGKRVFYPRIDNNRAIAFFEVLAAAELRAGRFGILEPTSTTRLSDSEYEGLVIFVPGVGFDTQGSRLGRGQGWYDRLLKGVGEGSTVVALAYEFQVVEAVPVDPWDQRVQYVITEGRVIDCVATPAQSSQISYMHPSGRG
jgi:5-formyltetrahydrofolate cyclo-ligase